MLSFLCPAVALDTSCSVITPDLTLYSALFFRAGGILPRGGSSVHGTGSWRKWGLDHEAGAGGEDKKEQRGPEGALEEGHPAADPAPEDGEGEPEAAG